MVDCGVLNIDKPPGITSRDVVDRVVRLVRPAKAGHAGTLDPMATGVLVVCVGQATRLINVVQVGKKLYLGRFVLGQQSDTDDITGNVTDGGNWSDVTEGALAHLLTDFVGQINQIPPQFSAVHVQGKRAYSLARRGEVVDLVARPVEVFSIRLTEFRPPEFELEIECGSGTYVRSIGRDIGIKLGCGAVMTQLRRLAVGKFHVRESISAEHLTAETLKQNLLPAVSIVSDFSKRHLTSDEVIAIRLGKSVAQASVADDVPNARESQTTGNRIALINPNGDLIGIGENDPRSLRLQPRIVFPSD